MNSTRLQISDLGFDLKQPGVARRLLANPTTAGDITPSTYAHNLFDTKQFTLLRIPIFAIRSS